MPKVVAIVQSRMGSTRLPGKALELVGQKTITEHVLERASLIRVDQVVVAVPSMTEYATYEFYPHHPVTMIYDEAIPEENVLQRFAYVASVVNADVCLRLTGDCPLLAPEVAEGVLQRFFEEGVDFAHNDTLTSGFPDGTDIEVFSRELLERAHREATSADDCEHVTKIMKRLPGVRIATLRSETDYSTLKISVDTAEDLARVRAIYAELEPGRYDLDATITAARKAGVWV